MEDRLYDLLFILMPTTPEEEIAKVISTLEQVATEHGGRVEKVEKWGNRKLAYRVAKQREGYYVHMALHSTQGELIKELERRLKVADPVIKYMTVRLDEEIKRQQKLIAKREKRARRNPRRAAQSPAAAPPAPPPPAQPEPPAAAG